MGCPVLDNAEYHEIIVSNGRSQNYNFAKRNRRILKVWTYDQHVTFSWDADGVCMNGPAGTEIMVKFTIGTKET